MSDPFAKLNKLWQQLEMTKQAKPSLDSEDEIDAGKHVEPGDSFVRELQNVLEESFPTATSAYGEEEPDVEEAQEHAEETYALTPDPTIPSGDISDVDTHTDEPSEEDLTEESENKKFGRLSDTQLLRKYATAVQRFVVQVALETNDPTLEKVAGLTKNADYVAAKLVAQIVKQAEFDASLLGGFYLGQQNNQLLEMQKQAVAQQTAQNVLAKVAMELKAAEEEAEDEEEEAVPEEESTVNEALEELATEVPGLAPEEITEAAAEVAEEGLPEEEEESSEKPETTEEAINELAESMAEVLTNSPDLVQSLGGDPSEFEDKEEVAEKIKEVLEETPEVAEAVHEQMAQAADVLMGETVKESMWQKYAQNAPPMPQLPPGMPIDQQTLQQIADAVQNDPAAAKAVQEAAQEIARVLQEQGISPEGLTEEAPEEEGGEEETSPEEPTPEETPTEEAPPEEAPAEEEVPPEEAQSEGEKAAMAQLAALSAELAANQITPDELAALSPKAVKLAAAIKTFRNMPLSRTAQAKKMAQNPRLRAKMRQYLAELLMG